MEYTSIKVRKEFVEEIEKTIQENPHLGYRSVSEFILDSTRRRIELLKNEKNSKK